MEKLRYVMNSMPPAEQDISFLMSDDHIKEARSYHRIFPQYSETPLADLKHMAEYLRVGSVMVKDESWRFGLNAFKVLGGSYAIGKIIEERTGIPLSELTYERLCSDEIKKKTGSMTVLTATDGNHGRGVAWTAGRLGIRCIVKMPAGSTVSRLENIANENAEAAIEDANYDECVRMIAALAEEIEGSVIVQDTSWEGYEQIPEWIMQGYGTMAQEAAEQLGSAPTHIFLQAGVGSMAGAVTGYFTQRYSETPPKVIVVEPFEAACHYKSALRGDGSVCSVSGSMPTIMAGLACGEVNETAWKILRNHVSCFIAADDSLTVSGMRMLAAPVKGDPQVVSGESGAAGFGVLAAIMLDDRYAELRDKLELNSDSQILCFSTEGNTDPVRYRSIVWEGENK